MLGHKKHTEVPPEAPRVPETPVVFVTTVVPVTPVVPVNEAEAASLDDLVPICAGLGKKLRICFGELPVESEGDPGMIAEFSHAAVQLMFDEIRDLSISDAYKVVVVTLEDFFKRYLRFKSPSSSALVSTFMVAQLMERLMEVPRASEACDTNALSVIAVGVTIRDLRAKFKTVTRSA